jgi:hypothetical protein
MPGGSPEFRPLLAANTPTRATKRWLIDREEDGAWDGGRLGGYTGRLSRPVGTSRIVSYSTVRHSLIERWDSGVVGDLGHELGVEVRRLLLFPAGMVIPRKD